MDTNIASLHGQQMYPTKRAWSAPALSVVEINSAEGSQTGPLCDKHGSLSTGGTCP